MRHRYRYVASDACEVANKYVHDLFEDPMTRATGCGDEILEGWLAKHVKTCAECSVASTEANMP